MNTSKKYFCSLIASIVLLLHILNPVSALSQSIIFVKTDAAGMNNGTSWHDAFSTLEEALRAASEGDELWVAQGIYIPTVQRGGTGERYRSFQMKNGVSIYGGFRGGEIRLTQRDIHNNQTILSGDIGMSGVAEDNCLHVFYHPASIALNTTAMLDGFIITGGNADGSSGHGAGGGMWNAMASPTIVNCTFTGNTATVEGGGMRNHSGASPTLINCSFTGNIADSRGAGMYNYGHSNPTIIDCSFIGNTSHTGAGMYNDRSSPTLTGCTFTANAAAFQGGGMYNAGASGHEARPSITQSMFVSNSAASHHGGAVYNARYAHPLFKNTEFIENSAGLQGGGVYNTRNNPVFIDCVFIGNIVSGTGSSAGGGAMHNNTSTVSEGPLLLRCLFENNRVCMTDARGGALFNSINPGFLTISDCTFRSNKAQYGAGIYNSSGNDRNRDASRITITNCLFENQEAVYGAGIMNDRHNTVITSTRLRGNNAAQQGGGVYNRYGAPTLTNCLLSGNKAGNYGGALYNNTATPEIINSTLSSNFALRGGAIACINASFAVCSNSIIWGNTASIEGNQLHISANSSIALFHSTYGNADGEIHIDAGGIFEADAASFSGNPTFEEPVAPSNENTPHSNGDFRIRSASPCIDAGHNNFIDETFDIRGPGFHRAVDPDTGLPGTVDMGAFEYQYYEAEEPTLIELVSLQATPKERAVRLHWATAAETFNAGFNIYRATSANGSYLQINDVLIPAEGTATQGAEYVFIDKVLKNRTIYYYLLEDIDLSGISTLYGPVSATPRRLHGLFK